MRRPILYQEEFKELEFIPMGKFLYVLNDKNIA